MTPEQGWPQGDGEGGGKDVLGVEEATASLLPHPGGRTLTAVVVCAPRMRVRAQAHCPRAANRTLKCQASLSG